MSRFRLVAVLAASVLATYLRGDPAAAQRDDPLRLPEAVVTQPVIPAPAASIATPTAFGADLGQAFVGAGFQARTRYTHDSDAAFVAGVGLGDRNLLGVEVAATSYSTFSSRGGTVGEVGSLSIRLHRTLGRDAAVAVGWENPVRWGDSDAGDSRYLVVSRVFRDGSGGGRPFSAAVVSLGIGDGRFRTEAQVAEGRERVNLFVSTGVRLHENASAVLDWTGQDLNAALSFRPLGRRLPVIVTPGVADLTRNAGDGPRAILGLGYTFNYRNPFARRD